MPLAAVTIATRNEQRENGIQPARKSQIDGPDRAHVRPPLPGDNIDKNCGRPVDAPRAP